MKTNASIVVRVCVCLRVSATDLREPVSFRGNATDEVDSSTDPFTETGELTAVKHGRHYRE